MRATATLVLLVLLAAGVTGCGGSSGSSSPPASSSPSSSTSSTPSTSPSTSTGTGADGATSTEVSFDAQGTTTYGTLEVPAAATGQRVAAALLLPGSGPTDRDGNQAGGITPDTLRLVATILARQGIASLRFDKYGTGRTGLGKLAADPASSSVQDDLAMARSAYDFLAKQPDVDPTRLLVVGHSEGGMIALSIATADPTKPAGLALLEPQDEQILDLVRIQTDEVVSDLADAGKLSAAQERSNEQGVAQAVADFRAGRTVDTSSLDPTVAGVIAPILEEPTEKTYVTTWDAVDPVALAGEVRSGTRVLVTDGTRDTNVPPSTIGPLVSALHQAGTTGPGLVTIQGTDHLMHLPSQPDTQPVLAPAEVAAIRAWATPFAT